MGSVLLAKQCLAPSGVRTDSMPVRKSIPQRSGQWCGARAPVSGVGKSWSAIIFAFDQLEGPYGWRVLPPLPARRELARKESGVAVKAGDGAVTWCKVSPFPLSVQIGNFKWTSCASRAWHRWIPAGRIFGHRMSRVLRRGNDVKGGPARVKGLMGRQVGDRLGRMLR
jgi:hypothetical protein